MNSKQIALWIASAALAMVPAASAANYTDAEAAQHVGEEATVTGPGSRHRHAGQALCRDNGTGGHAAFDGADWKNQTWRGLEQPPARRRANPQGSCETFWRCRFLGGNGPRRHIDGHLFGGFLS